MARGKCYNEELLVEYLRRYKTAAGKAGRGNAIRWFMERTGASWSTANGVMKKLLRGERVADIARARQARKKRKNDLERAREKRDALVIHGIKSRPGKDKKWIPTDRALEIAGEMGLVPYGKYTRSTMDRILDRLGLNFRSAGIEPMAHRITAEYPGQVYLVDATTMDQYYMSLDMTVERYDAPRGDQHLDDYLRKNELVKIWVYYLVDMYSKAFLPFPVIPLKKSADSKNGGENADDWLDALSFFFLPKRGLPSPLDSRSHPLADCPVEGIPTILMCDMGSGIGKSSRVNDMCRHLGITIKTHMPGKPSSKGGVESRIGAFKRRFESQLNDVVIRDINQLVYFYLASAHWWNHKQGYYAKWMKGVSSHPIIRVDVSNLQDAMVSNIVRTVNGFGCVKIDGHDWFVTPDGKYRNTKATIYRPPARDGNLRYIAELYDGAVVECSNGIPEHPFMEIKSHKKTDGDRNREEGRLYAKSINRMMTFDDILPRQEETNVVRMPSPSRGIETHSPAAPESFDSIERAWRWILNQTGLFKEDLSDKTCETIQNLLEIAIEKNGAITSDVAIALANLVNQNKIIQGANES
ncbi:MAG: DDE-type integrase/transposase/recombinase [Spirochaetes bacterium]|nr:DDE-type integrase/transposase/recombinase [Spirochaetota bacterium]